MSRKIIFTSPPPIKVTFRDSENHTKPTVKSHNFLQQSIQGVDDKLRYLYYQC
jgi:hypothetical protein